MHGYLYTIIMNKTATEQIDNDKYWMQHAIQLAKQAEQEGEVPVGAVLVCDDKIIGEGWNQMIANHDPSAHAEIQAVRSAAQSMKNYRLPNTTLYVTLEPCTMCAGAMIHARITRLVFGAYDPKTGVAESRDRVFDASHHNHQIDVSGGVLQAECSEQLKVFFKAKRELNKKNRDQQY